MAQQTINIGASPNDGTGTPLRTAFQYTNSNFSELYTAVGPSGNNIVCPGSATITGDLTVDTNTLKVVAATDSVGVGFTPSAWGGSRKAIQIGSPAQLASADLTLEIGSNWWHDGTNYKYTATNPACLYSPSNGSHVWANAASGTAGTNIGWSTLMTLNDNGLGVGKVPASNQSKVQIYQALGTSLNGAIHITDDATTSFVFNNTSSGVSSIWTSGVLTFSTGSNAYSTNGARMTLDASGRLILLASTTTPATLATNGQLTFTATSDTNLRFSYRGSDGVTRVANITLA